MTELKGALGPADQSLVEQSVMGGIYPAFLLVRDKALQAMKPEGEAEVTPAIVVFSVHDDLRRQLSTALPVLLPGVELVVKGTVASTMNAIRGRVGRVLMIFVEIGNDRNNGYSVASYVREADKREPERYLDDSTTPIVCVRRDPSVLYPEQDEFAAKMFYQYGLNAVASTPLTVDELCITVMEALHRQLGTLDELNLKSRERFLAEFFGPFLEMLDSWRSALEGSDHKKDPLVDKIIALLAQRFDFLRVLGVPCPKSAAEIEAEKQESELRKEEYYEVLEAIAEAKRQEARQINEEVGNGATINNRRERIEGASEAAGVSFTASIEARRMSRQARDPLAVNLRAIRQMIQELSVLLSALRLQMSNEPDIIGMIDAMEQDLPAIFKLFDLLRAAYHGHFSSSWIRVQKLFSGSADFVALRARLKVVFSND